jgi:hypothetical protein
MGGRGLVGAALLTGLSVPALAADSIPWARDPEAAFVQAGERRGAVMILFTGANCGPKALPGEIAGGLGAKPTLDFRDKCELLELDVLSRPEVVVAAARYTPLIVEQGLVPRSGVDTLVHRYRVFTLPTLLFADPWRNEILRLVGVVPRDRFVHVLKALPDDFSELEPAGRLLQQEPDNASALVAAAGFYDARGLFPVSEGLYEKALATRELREDPAARRPVAIARGGALLRIGRTGDAAKLFERTLQEAPDGPQSDALLFGWLMAELQAGRLDEARDLLATLTKRFPDSPYRAKAAQNLAAVDARKK